MHFNVGDDGVHINVLLMGYNCNVGDGCMGILVNAGDGGVHS